MTAELDITPIPEVQRALLSTIIESVESDNFSLYEIILGSMILVEYGYVSTSDYSIKVGLYGEKQTFIDIAKEALWLNENDNESWH